LHDLELQPAAQPDTDSEPYRGSDTHSSADTQPDAVRCANTDADRV